MGIEKYYNEIYGALTPRMEEEINTYKTTYDSQRNTLKENYSAVISDTNTDYYDEANRNAIQKIVNEKKIAENMENLGLTDSGLNRTQQTASQLSYSNNQAKLERQRQKAVDALNLEMTGKLAEIDIDESNTVSAIKDTYHKAALSAAQEQYNAELETAAEIEKARLEASAKGGTGGDSGNAKLFKFSGYDIDSGKMTYYDSDGKLKSFSAGQNPYTSSYNARVTVSEGKVTVDEKWADAILKDKKATDINKAAADYGVFSNGYQPKGVYENGKAVGAVHSLTTFDAEDGRTGVNLWYTESGSRRSSRRYWVWDGKHNTYKEVTYDSTTGAINEI